MRLVVVSNRLPIVLKGDGGALEARPAAGGLVAALGPILHHHGGLWVGWPGIVGSDLQGVDPALAEYGRRVGFNLVPVPMSKRDVEDFYQGFSNEIIWPLFHDLQSRCNFVPDYWTRYVAIRHTFADTVLTHLCPDDFIWVHDYHLMGMGRRLREREVKNPMGFFLHIPFPPPDIFCKLPWRTDVLEGLLHHDLVGFQTPRDVENFLDRIRRLLPSTRLRDDGEMTVCEIGSLASRVGAFPVGIDFQRISRSAGSKAIAERAATLRSQMPDQQIILSIDRLDYTKGIPYRLRAFQLALSRFPALHRNVTLLQVVVPSRENVPEYQDLKAQIERLVTQINGEFTRPGWVPIHHVFRSLDETELFSYYRAADVALVTPLKDGMNLIAKEYCACQVEGNGVLILSEFAGAAVQMSSDALLVNPYDLDRVADAIQQAVRLTPEERKPTMSRLRSGVRREDVFWWADQFLRACGLDDMDQRRSESVAAAG